MIIEPAPIDGLWRVTQERHRDDRGYFCRTACEDEFAARGLNTCWPQQNLSHNDDAHTLRGMHYQLAPQEETKLVSCVRGSVWDVAVDLRPDSATYGQWYGTELSAENGVMLYIPGGFAHGFLTLEAGSTVHYLMGATYHADLQRGLRWDDPDVAIAWPHAPAVIGDRDRALPSLHDRDA